MLTIACIQDPSQSGWLVFRNVETVLSATSVDQVLTILRQVEQANAEGLSAVGFVSYEASRAFDPALCVQTKQLQLPLAWFALARSYSRCSSMRELSEFSQIPAASSSQDSWNPDISRSDYSAALCAIKGHLERGDSYQANFSFRLRCRGLLDPQQTFQRIYNAHCPDYAAYIETEQFAIFSASPELFFSLDGTTLECKPMKGTAPRGKTLADDLERRKALRNSEKDQAENVMIVDMIRNDMSKVAQDGTVTPTELFSTERYPKLWQLTSTVTCQTNAGLTDIFSALFPCASITGAPRVSTMKILSQVERSPREIYTGALGVSLPGRRAVFNVAIRTGWMNKRTREAEFGVGSGIVWDSVERSEYEECLLKGQVLVDDPIEFRLFETLRWENAKGFFLLEQHIARLRASAEYFSFSCPDVSTLRKSLEDAISAPEFLLMRVKLTLDRDGSTELQAEPFMPASPSGPVQLSLAVDPVCSDDVYLYHKTTNRRSYRNAQKNCLPDTEAVLWNDHGEITETPIANIVIRDQGKLVTPPIGCGLLSGVFREFLIEQGILSEAIISVSDLQKAEAIYLINSLRGWRKGSLATRGVYTRVTG